MKNTLPVEFTSSGWWRKREEIKNRRGKWKSWRGFFILATTIHSTAEIFVRKYRSSCLEYFKRCTFGFSFFFHISLSKMALESLKIWLNQKSFSVESEAVHGLFKRSERRTVPDSIFSEAWGEDRSLNPLCQPSLVPSLQASVQPWLQLFYRSRHTVNIGLCFVEGRSRAAFFNASFLPSFLRSSWTLILSLE